MIFLVRLFVIIGLIIGTAYVFQKNKDPNQFQKTLNKSSHKVTPTRKTEWDENSLRLRKILASQAQVSEKWISKGDIEFSKEFKNFIFQKTPIYSILTEQKSFAFQNAIQTLSEFEKQFRGSFAPLASITKNQGLQVVIFDSESTFSQFRSRMGLPAWMVGFYHFHQHRLYLYNSMDITKSTSPLSHVKIPFRYQEILLPTLTGQMDQTLSLMRHEGSHQLFIEYKIIPTASAAWLHEGMASFCEKSQIGLSHRQYMTLLMHIPRISVSQLMQIQSFVGLNEEQALISYTLSWALAYYLMQGDRKIGFYNFLREVRKNPAASTQIQRLSTYLKITPQKLESDFDNFLKAMSGR